jgi:hypothetical protein
MDETELISSLQSHISSTLSVPVRTNALEDERPVPVIIIDDWSTEDFNFHNSAMAGDFLGDHDNDGKDEYERYLSFDYKTRVEFLVRHSDEVEVSRLKEKLKHEIRLIRENPFDFNDSLKQCLLRTDGAPSNTFVEPKEAELMLAVDFYADHVVTRTDFDQLNEVIETFGFN